MSRNLIGLGVLAATAFGGNALAQGVTLGPLSLVTPGDLFSSCTADNPSGQPGTLFAGAAVEPNLAINPANPSNLLFGTQEDRWNNGGSRGARLGYSMDGGTTFTATTSPGVTQCQGGPWPRSSDPWVSFSPDGTAYLSVLVVKESTNPNAIAAASGQVVSKSMDGGITWGNPIVLIRDFNPNVLDDKNSVTADAADSSYAYVVWDRLRQFVPGTGVADEGGGTGSGGATPNAAVGGMDATDIAHRMLDHARAVAAGKAKPPFQTQVIGPTYFSRTTNAGRSWTPPAIIWNPGPNSQTIGNQIVTLPNGQIADFFTELQDNSGGQPARIGLVISADHGATWSGPNYAQSQVNLKAMTPNLLQPIRSADILYATAVDPTNGVVYLVWEDSRFSGNNEIAFAWSPDNGFTWTPPVKINQTPRSAAGPFFQQALIPTVAVAGDGTVVVTYYDFRNDTPGATTDDTDFWAVVCNTITSADNCLSTGDWSNETRMTTASFNWDDAPLTTSGVFVGDYMSMKPLGQTIDTVFGQATGVNTTGIFFRSLTLPTATAAAQ